MGPTFVVSVEDIAVPVNAADTRANLVSVLEIPAPASNGIRIIGLDLSFDGTDGSQKPALVQVIAGTTAGTFPANNPGVTAENNDPGAVTSTVASAGVQFGAATSEGAVVPAGRGWRQYRLNPSGGMVFQLPLGRELWVPKAQFLRVRMVAKAAVNVTINVSWEQG